MNNDLMILKLREAGHSNPDLGSFKVDFRLNNQRTVTTLNKLSTYRKLKEKGHTDPVAALERFGFELKRKRNILEDISFFSDPKLLKQKGKVKKD